LQRSHSGRTTMDDSSGKLLPIRNVGAVSQAAFNKGSFGKRTLQKKQKYSIPQQIQFIKDLIWKEQNLQAICIQD
jgi:hypothetical protein